MDGTLLRKWDDARTVASASLVWKRPKLTILRTDPFSGATWRESRAFRQQVKNETSLFEVHPRIVERLLFRK